MATVKFGDVFSGLKQTLSVNVWASKADPDAWKPSGDVKVSYGEKWYYGTLTHKDKTVSERYLVHDQVLDDGFGAVEVYKDVTVVDHDPDTTLPENTNTLW